jgi:capsular polysaccharide biosynthesis protein
MRLLQRANVRVVQVIGVELVAAALLNTPKKMLVMVHVRSQGDKGIVDVTVRSSNKGLSEGLAKFLAVALK